MAAICDCWMRGFFNIPINYFALYMRKCTNLVWFVSERLLHNQAALEHSASFQDRSTIAAAFSPDGRTLASTQ